MNENRKIGPRAGDIGHMADGTPYVRTRMSEAFPDGSLAYPIAAAIMVGAFWPFAPLIVGEAVRWLLAVGMGLRND